ncbi:MAG: SiaB family protein kinase [Bacteroidota bacterium]
MKLDVSFIKLVLNLYDEMRVNGISLVYLGEFNHQITKMFTNMQEEELTRKDEERKTIRRVYHAMVETLQNMNKHSDELMEPGQVGSGFFVIGKKEATYYIITSNKVANDKIPGLKSALEEVNSATPQELKEMFKKQIKEGSLSDKGGAGLGLIDIARKSGYPLDYQFLPLDQTHSFFILKVEIHARKSEME